MTSAKMQKVTQLKLDMLIDFTLQLEQLLHAKLSLPEALLVLIEDKGRAAPLAQQVLEDLTHGQLFSQALSNHARIFDQVYIGFIKMGEETGSMAEHLEYCLEHLQWVQSQRDHIRKATRYPIFLLLLISIIMFVLLVVLVPELAPFLDTLHREKSLTTRIVLRLSNLITQHGYLVLGGGVGSALFVRILIGTCPNVRKTVRSILLHLPVIGPFLQEVTLGRYFHILGHMSAHNLSLMKALEVAEHGSEIGAKTPHIKSIRDHILNGASLSEALTLSGQIPTVALRMVARGESTGDLATALLHTKAYFDRRIDTTLDKLITYLGPAMTIIAGLFLILIVYAVFWPLYETFELVDV